MSEKNIESQDIALEHFEVESRVGIQEYSVNELLEWRVRWGQRGMCCLRSLHGIIYFVWWRSS